MIDGSGSELNNLKGQIFILSHDKEVLLNIDKYIKNENFHNKKIFEIKKLDFTSIITENKIKDDNDTIYIYNELKKALKNKDFSLYTHNLPRELLEKIFSICFEDDTNFTQCYNNFFKCRNIKPKYTPSNIQKLNHKKKDIDLSAELEEKFKFVIEVFEEFTKIKV